MKDFLSIKFKVWRQVSNESNGSYEQFSLEKVSVKISLLEALDQLNEELTTKNIRPITFCLLYTSPSPRDRTRSRMPSSA